ncbi:MAG: hypothetical protein ACRYGF_03630 [Janthinobacterium lividum]
MAATKAAVKAETEKIYECEVKRRRVAAKGGYEPFWKVKNVGEAVIDGDTEFRCKDCHGSIKLHKMRVQNGAAAYVEHASKLDSEYCPSGLSFKNAADGREARLSEDPVR